MSLRSFLHRSFRNTFCKRELALQKKTALRHRLFHVHTIDNELERGFCMLKEYTKGGDFWLNCLVSPEPFWYLSGK